MIIDQACASGLRLSQINSPLMSVAQARASCAATIKAWRGALLPEVATQAFRDKSRVPVRPIVIAMSK